MCGVLGLTGSQVSLGFAANYLQLLSHRGQDASGLGWLGQDDRIHVAKTKGLPKNLAIPVEKSKAIVGSTRYPTFGSRSGEIDINSYSQPFGFYELDKFLIAHNGNITNIPMSGKKYESDAEYIAEVLGKAIFEYKDLEHAVAETMEVLDGAYAIVGLYNDYLFAFRDPHGIRPLSYGENHKLQVFSSESYVIEAMGVHDIKEVKPGELVILEVMSNGDY